MFTGKAESLLEVLFKVLILYFERIAPCLFLKTVLIIFNEAGSSSEKKSRRSTIIKYFSLCIPSLKFHFTVKRIFHLNYNVHFVNTENNYCVYSSGYNILKCKNSCWAVATKKESVLWDKPHYHCFGCNNLFNRSRALKHYQLHAVHTPDLTHVHSQQTPTNLHQMQTVNTTQPKQLQQTQPSQQPTNPHQTQSLQTHTGLNDQHQLPQSPTASPSLHSSPLETDPSPDNSNSAVMTMHNIGPSPASFTKQSSSERVSCPHCSREFHPHSLKVFYAP